MTDRPAHRDASGRPVVVVTGMGAVTSLGLGTEENWERLANGISGIRPITRFPTDGLKTTFAGTIDVAAEPPSLAARSEALALLAAEEAVGQAGLGRPGQFPGPLFAAVPPMEVSWPQRIEIAVASGAGEGCSYDDLLRTAPQFPGYHPRFLYGSIADRLADAFGTQGSPISIQTACSSGASAIQFGVEAIRRGETDAALCVGADCSVSPEAIVRFSLLSALSTRNDDPQAASRPFSSDRDGFVMAEGAGALVLETLAAATARGARVLGVVEGCGEAADSFHLTRSSPDGHAIVDCIERAIRDAGVTPEHVDHVNAHGTSTPENDKMECVGLMHVFGDRAATLPVSSNKSMIGHTLSAAGAIEAVFSLLTLEHQRIPPTINYQSADPAIPLDVVANVARDMRVARVLSNSFGFGGQNVSLVLAREPA